MYADCYHPQREPAPAQGVHGCLRPVTQPRAEFALRPAARLGRDRPARNLAPHDFNNAVAVEAAGHQITRVGPKRAGFVAEDSATSQHCREHAPNTPASEYTAPAESPAMTNKMNSDMHASIICRRYGG